MMRLILKKGSETYCMNSWKKGLSVLLNIWTVCLVLDPAPELDPGRLGSTTTHFLCTCYTFACVFNTGLAHWPLFWSRISIVVLLRSCKGQVVHMLLYCLQVPCVFHEISEIISTVSKISLVTLAQYFSRLANMRASSSAMYSAFLSFSIPENRILLLASINCASPVLAADLFTENWVKDH